MFVKLFLKNKLTKEEPVEVEFFVWQIRLDVNGFFLGGCQTIFWITEM